MTFSHDATLKHVIWRMMDLNDISRDTPLKHMLFDLFMAFNAIFPWHAPKQHVIWCIYGIFPWHALKKHFIWRARGI